MQIPLVTWMQDDQVWAYLLSLPVGHARLNAKPFGNRVGGEHDAVPIPLTAAHRDRVRAEGGVVQNFDGGIVLVGVTMQNQPVHALQLVTNNSSIL